MNKQTLLKLTTVLGAGALGVMATTGVVNADAVYTVKAGDTLTGIAKQLKLGNGGVTKLVQDNHLTDANQLQVGQQLVVKDGQGTPAGAANQAAQEIVPATQASSGQNAGEAAAKDWIVYHESRGSYTAQNGRYYGKYQLDLAYLGGDLSPAHQDQVADQYVATRYGSWTAAQQFWQANGWY